MDQHTVVRGVAAAAAAVTLTALGVVAVRGEERPASLVAAQPAPPPAASSAPPAEEPTPPLTPSARPTAESPSATTAPSPRPSGDPVPDPPLPTVTVPPVTLPPHPTLPPTPDLDADVSVTVSHDRLPTATKMVLTVRWRAAEGMYVKVLTDDGQLPMTPAGTGCGGSTWPYDVVTVGGFSTVTVPWSYRRAGTYDVRAQRAHNPCYGPGPVRPTVTSEPVRVTVTQGAVRANGPNLPVGKLAIQTGEEADATEPHPYTLWYGIGGRDVDGWVWRYVVDWDGSGQREHTSDPGDCRREEYNPDTTWPTTGILSGAFTSHTVPGPGTYRVTLTVYSSNCDLGEVQTATVTRTVVVPPA